MEGEISRERGYQGMTWNWESFLNISMHWKSWIVWSMLPHKCPTGQCVPTSWVIAVRPRSLRDRDRPINGNCGGGNSRGAVGFSTSRTILHKSIEVNCSEPLRPKKSVGYRSSGASGPCSFEMVAICRE